MKTILDNILDRAEAIQVECQEYVSTLMKDQQAKNLTVQDITTVYLYTKIAELQLKLEALTNLQTIFK